MRRRRRHLLIACLFAAVLGGAGAAWLRSGGGAARPVAEADLGSAAQATPVYVLDRDRWTVFRVPGSAERIQVLSHAGTGAGAPAATDAPMEYAIDFRLTSIGGVDIDSGRWTYRVGTRPPAASDGSNAGPTFYETASIVPSSPRRSQIDLEGGEVVLLALRSTEFRPPVRDIAVRVAIRQDVPERKLAYLWARKSAEQRAQLTASRVHGAAGLTDAERRSLLLTRWSPIGPQGVEGKDYEARILYQREDGEAAEPSVDQRIDVDAVRVGAGLRAVLGVPSAGRVRLRFRSPDGAPDTAASATPVMIRYFGTSLRERASHAHRPGAQGDFVAEFGPGMLEIAAESPWFVEGTLADEMTGRESVLASDARITRAWRCAVPMDGPEGDVVFAFGEEASGHLLKLALRAAVGGSAVADVAWLDADGRAFGQLVVPVGGEPSLHDCLIDEGDWRSVSEPEESVVAIPPGARGLRIVSESEVLVSAHTRPAGLPYRVSVPEDYVRAVGDPDRLPLWFPLSPPDAEERIRGFRSVLLRLQDRPPLDDSDVLAGRYEWEDFDPVSGGIGTYLLCPRDSQGPERREAAPSVFSEVPTDGRSFQLPVFAALGVESPVRRLVFIRTGDEAEAASLRLLRNGTPILGEQLVGLAGEFVLPAAGGEERAGADPADWRIECGADDVRCFVNYVAPESASWVRRFAHRISPQRELCFEVAKRSDAEELLTAAFHAPAGTIAPSTITLHIEPLDEAGRAAPRAAGRFTPRHREFVVDPARGEEGVFALNGIVSRLGAEQRFFVPLGDDLPSGRYRLAFRMTEGSEGCLSLSRITGGDHPWARFTREDGR